MVLVAGCGAGGPVAVGPPGSDEPVPTTTATTVAVPASDGGGADLDAKALLAGVRPSIGLVTTATSQGSGVLVDGGYVVTNAHVIDPYATATITFEGDPPIEEVPVAGVDPFADIALLGPIEVDRAPLTLASEVRLDQGDGVYLVGYPGEYDVAPEVAISSGLVSRLRDVRAPRADVHPDRRGHRWWPERRGPARRSAGRWSASRGSASPSSSPWR